MTDTGDYSIPKNFLQPSWIAWKRSLTPDRSANAFALYERHWRFIEPVTLTPEQARLIADLKAQFGDGQPLDEPPRADG